MLLSTKTPRALAAIFESPSDDEDFLGFAVPVLSDSESDSLASEDSGKPAMSFRSKFVTSELVSLFSHSDNEEEEFEGFSEEEEEKRGSRSRTKAMCIAEESDEDTGFYSEGEEPDTHKRKSLCVAFRFPTKRLSAQKGEAPINAAPAERRTNERLHLKRGLSQESSGRETQGQKPPPQKGAIGKETMEVESRVLNKRAKNIQENKAMLAKLFADLTNMSEVTSSPTKRRVSEKPPPRRRGVCEGSERRNPSRAARPPEKFGVEERSTSPSRHDRSVRTIDVGKLLEVDELGRNRKKRRASSGKKRRITHVRSVDEITEEELDNVAQRAKDKILDKDHGSTCHQCRQKTLDTKTVCRSGVCIGGKGQFCGPCLRNRYGEDVHTALLDPDWECPLCRGICNCSLCRRREGRCATGQLVHLAQHKGHSNVQDYLESIQKDLRS
ncbi:cell division cycle-associated 7-like protein isoform X2 [Salvelinus fontinalis]|uniref:cell division cycle-associated 7-like protein isoform X2 n=1 Tax=Salvelinus fontinalis TaxID=8038 RepID=UPI0024858D6A|nr:cell division cycle-associated 7-like protein isoform X2 [Salvelinus fontinalis]